MQPQQPRQPLRLVHPGQIPGLDDNKPGATSNPDIRESLRLMQADPATTKSDIIMPKFTSSNETLSAINQKGPTADISPSAVSKESPNPFDTDPMRALYGSSYEDLVKSGAVQVTPIATFLANMIKDPTSAMDSDLKSKIDAWMIESLVKFNSLYSAFIDVGKALDQFETTTQFNYQEWQSYATRIFTIERLEILMKISGLNEDYSRMIITGEIDRMFGRSKQLELEAKSKELKSDEAISAVLSHLVNIADVLNRGFSPKPEQKPSVFVRPPKPPKDHQQ